MTFPDDGLANARLAAIVGSSEDAIVGKTLDGIITDWNRAAERLFGYSAEEAIGRHISLISPPGGEDEMTTVIERIRKGEQIEPFETRRRHRDGSLISVLLAVSPIYDASGRIVGASKIARDITERLRLQADTRLLAAIVDASDDAIVSKDLNGIVTSWNRGAEALFGYTAEEMIGHPIMRIAHPERPGEMQEIIAKIRRGERLAHFETKRRRKDGSTVHISLTVSPIYDGAGRIVGASKIARDISERRRADERMQLLLRELDHRAKNVLAVAQAMLRLTRADTVPDYVRAIEGRIRALACVHGQMAENRWEGAELRALAAADIEVFSEDSGRMQAEGPPTWVSPSAAQVVAIVLHELATNATKYGALSSAEGTAKLAWARDSSGDLRLDWREAGGPAARPPERRGFGTQVIERSIPDQLGGSAELTWGESGLACVFVIPASHIVERPTRRSATAI